MFGRANSMKSYNDESVTIQESNGEEVYEKKPLITSNEQEIIANFSEKYGLPFSLKHKQTRNDEKSPLNKKEIESQLVENNNVHNNGNNNTGKEHLARDRFRKAGMKARFARRMEKIVEDRMTVKQIFNRYVQNSTLHGFRFIFMKTFVIRRVAWAILTIFMATVFFTEMKNSVELFFEYPFTTTSTTEHVSTLKFPAISLCNLNGLQSSEIKKTKLKKLYEDGLLPFPTQGENPKYEIDGDELKSMLSTVSQSLDELLYSCEWKSRDTAKTGRPNICGVQNFSLYSDLQGQTCYTFNSGRLGHALLSLNETGLDMALKLELNLMTNESLDGLQDVGLKIVVHDQHDSPLQQAGFVVSPGFQTFVEMKVRKTENLPPPYATKCGKRPLKQFNTYSQSKCFLEQLSVEIKEKCKCRSVFMKDESLPLCSLKKTMTCLMPTVHDFDRKTSDACPVDCSTLQYITSLSYARFLSTSPDENHILRDQSEKWIKKLKTRMPPDDSKYIQENVVVVQFFFQEMTEENVKQEPSYDFYKLVGDVGGQLGLMLGASVLTLVEFVDLFLFTCYHQLLRLSRQKKEEHVNRIS